MSRSGYTDDYDTEWQLIMWRGAVKSAIRGKRGQAFLKEMLTALDALPEPQLIDGYLEFHGQVCAVGSVGVQRGIDMSKIDAHDPYSVAKAFGIARAMAAEIEFINDDDYGWRKETPEQRFQRVRSWVVSKIKCTAHDGRTEH